ncbi:GNAT family N-acetyltransferase [Francisella sp. 19X1-34]|uniref:GNAT family N-acetyltransferase n=1 Tax=Francisella sp. 19X1-34 TaxID=3087177 RepID=UPI002E346FD9|nr:GNAT family N-acetyltransferase [Francisella sp. 19X1-34]MED7789404.1 GNAT family N-acetyltransferase [Francisella sp. 19X1-34]
MQTLNLDSSYFNEVISLIRFSDKSFSWSDQQILDSLKQDLAIGLIDNNKLKAIAIFSYIFETAELLYICVNKSDQGQGLGSKTLRESFRYLSNQNITEVFLEVDANNNAAIKLYNKLGCKKVSIRKNYYKKQDGSCSDALIYRLEIS